MGTARLPLVAYPSKFLAIGWKPSEPFGQSQAKTLWPDVAWIKQGISDCCAA